ncbi:hypothetical protein DL93DRAFT_2162079 [Clavulina sp. PMI_390]|nr:hypothetical protein DL93DRAFT_2162079 [Clavulina sp. PMI_390]
MLLFNKDAEPDSPTIGGGSDLVGRDDQAGRVVASRPAAEHHLDTPRWKKGEELPPVMVQYLISSFLPHAHLFHFFMDISYFVWCFSLPLSHPESIHPCLRNACYLAACNLLGDHWVSLEDYFLERTRHFLNQALMLAEQITHYLWASTILGCFLGRERRLAEAFVIAISAPRLASACGLDHNPDMDQELDSGPSQFLLPPPRHEAEANDRIRLSYSIYLGDVTLAAWNASPGVFKDTFMRNPPLGPFPSKGPTLSIHSKGELFEAWKGQIESRASMLKLFQRVIRCALALREDKKCAEEYETLKAEISSYDVSIPPLPDPGQPPTLENTESFNPHIFIAHTTFYGCGLILYSLRASVDAEAKCLGLKHAQSLVEICKNLRGQPRHHRAQIAIPMLPMINALRIIARELRTAATSGNARMLIDYCCALESILDFFDDAILMCPAWSDLPLSLKDVLTATANAVKASSWC